MRFVTADVHKDMNDVEYRSWKAFLGQSEGWSTHDIERYQLGELNRVLSLAKQTPYYARRFAEFDVLDAELASAGDIARFPTISKEEIRENLPDCTVAATDLEYVTTGGSTGIPLGLYRSRRAFSRELASKAHQYHRVGWREGDRQVVLRGLPIANPEGYEFFPEFNELRLSSYHLVPERMDYYCQLIEDYKPDWLRCYPSSAQLFASYLESTGRRVPPFKGILCASENLYDFQVSLLRRVFGCRVFSHYGHYELCALAGFCEREDTYHVLPQYGFTELLDERGEPVMTPGHVGEIVATSFFMDGTILVRYRTSDFAVYSGPGCPACGRPYQIWSRVDGRLQDFIVTASGRPISMTAINMHDDIFDAVKQFQFEQHEPGRVIFRYISLGESLTDVKLSEIRSRLAPKLGGEIEMEMVEVEDIPITRRGKHRFLIQNIPLSFGDRQRAGLFDVAIPNVETTNAL